MSPPRKAFPGAVDPMQSLILYPAPTLSPVPGSSLHGDLKCSQCLKIVTASASAENTMSRHFQNHCTVRTTRDGCHVPLQQLSVNGSPIFTRLCCQSFFAIGAQLSYFDMDTNKLVYFVALIDDQEALGYDAEMNDEAAEGEGKCGCAGH
jgi:hypothetical protein